MCIYICVYIFVQSLSYIRLSVTLWTVACQASPYFTISQVCSNSYPLSQWCQATISSSVAPFSSCPQSSTASGSFSKGRFLLRRWPKYQSFSFSISPFNAYSGWCPLGLTGLSSLQSKGLSRLFLSTTVQKHQFFGAHFLYDPNHIHTWLEKP